MRVALIGHGMVAATHLKAIEDAPGISLAGLLGRNVARARTFADHVGDVPTIYESIEDVAADENVDFAILTTPPNARQEIVECLAHARKPILMEKPIERSFDAARRLVETCEANETPLAIVFQHRARESSKYLRNLLENSALGTVQTVEIRVPWWRTQDYYDEPGRGTYARDGGGVLISQAIHTLDLALWLLGPVIEVQAATATTALHQMEAEDWAGALLSFRSGAVGILHATTAAYPGNEESIRIQGTKGAATLSAGGLLVDFLDGQSKVSGRAGGSGGGADPMAFTHAWHQAIIEDFAKALSSGKSPLCSGRDALSVHALISGIETAARTRKAEKVPET